MVERLSVRAEGGWKWATIWTQLRGSPRVVHKQPIRPQHRFPVRPERRPLRFAVRPEGGMVEGKPVGA